MYKNTFNIFKMHNISAQYGDKQLICNQTE